MNDEKIVKVLLRVDGDSAAIQHSGKDLWKIVKKQRKQIGGLKGIAAVLVIGGIILTAELAERKRCENYLKKELDELAEKHDALVDDFAAMQNNVDTRDESCSGGVSDA